MGCGRQKVVAVVGPGDASAAEVAVALDLGVRLAKLGVIVVTGGLGGVMEAANEGAYGVQGRTIGIIPGSNPDDANAWVELVLPSGLGVARNALVVAASDAIVAVGCTWGTLSEIAFACGARKPVITIGAWSVRDASGIAPDNGPITVDSAADAVTALAQLLASDPDAAAKPLSNDWHQSCGASGEL